MKMRSATDMSESRKARDPERNLRDFARINLGCDCIDMMSVLQL